MELRSSSESEILKSEDSWIQKQNSRMVSEFKANQIEINAQKMWDIFYKRNKTNFFKDRHWTTREFKELASNFDDKTNTERDITNSPLVIFEAGCGVGNFIFPIASELLNCYIYACDFSLRAVNFILKNPQYDEKRMHIFHCDITNSSQLDESIPSCSVDIASLIFVLSAIHPSKHGTVLRNIYDLLKPGGLLIFRDYGLHDMAQMRFGPGHKIAENLYMRQDGTRSYYFTPEEMTTLCGKVGFRTESCEYIYRRTVNKKEGVDVQRVFVQGKFRR